MADGGWVFVDEDSLLSTSMKNWNDFELRKGIQDGSPQQTNPQVLPRK